MTVGAPQETGQRRLACATGGDKTTLAPGDWMTRRTRVEHEQPPILSGNEAASDLLTQSLQRGADRLVEGVGGPNDGEHPTGWDSGSPPALARLKSQRDHASATASTKVSECDVADLRSTAASRPRMRILPRMVQRYRQRDHGLTRVAITEGDQAQVC